MKRILFIMHSMPIGGAERVLIDIFNHLDYNRYDIELLLYNNEGDNIKNVPDDVKIKYVFQPKKATLINRGIHKLLYKTNLISWIEKKTVRKVLHGQAYDTIVSFCQGPAHKLHTFLLDKSDNHISWIHSDLSKLNWGKLFFGGKLQRQERAYQQMTQIVHVSQGVKEAFNRVFNVPMTLKQHVVYNIVDADFIRTQADDAVVIPKSDDRFVFINSGRMVEQKQQVRLVEAANILRKDFNDFEIWILGDGPLRSEVQQCIDRYKLHDHVKLLGFKNNPFPYIKEADAFVLSSSQEGLPMVICEAMVLGKPVIATDIVGPKELLLDSRYGIVVPESIQDIATAMKTMATDYLIREKYTQRAMERASTFSVTDSMNRLYSVLNSCKHD